MKKQYIFNSILLLLITNLAAQSVCQEQLVINNGVSGYSIGQSIFMSGCDGYFHSIELNRSNDGAELTADLTIFVGQTFMGAPLYTQTVTIPATSGPFTIDFAGGTGDLAFFENSQYTFMLSNPDLQLEVSSTIDSYADGQLFVDVGFINADDLWFRLTTIPILGVDQYELNKVTLYPNPAHHTIHISGVDVPQDYAIYNVLGVAVLQGLVTTDQPIDIEELPVGLYFLKLNDKKTLRFVRN
ncbi:MAG: T9SS type A sorting domain-containing protein [Gelidibacter sp.]